jgi:hypothetical protein
MAQHAELDDAIAEAARTARVDFVSLREVFDGHELRCDQLQPRRAAPRAEPQP